MPFPKVGHRFLNLIDNTYAHSLTRQMLEARPLEPDNSLTAAVRTVGAAVDLQVTAYGILLASEKGLHVLSAYAAADFQSYPANVDGSPEVIHVINILRTTEDNPPSDDAAMPHLVRKASGDPAILLSPELVARIDDAGLIWSGTTKVFLL